MDSAPTFSSYGLQLDHVNQIYPFFAKLLLVTVLISNGKPTRKASWNDLFIFFYLLVWKNSISWQQKFMGRKPTCWSPRNSEEWMLSGEDKTIKVKPMLPNKSRGCYCNSDPSDELGLLPWVCPQTFTRAQGSLKWSKFGSLKSKCPSILLSPPK